MFTFRSHEQYSKSIFEGEAKTFNRIHSPNLPTDVKDRRIDLHRKRVADGYFIYIYLELCQQLGITDYQVFIDRRNFSQDKVLM